MKIKDYPLAGPVDKADVLLVDGNRGTRTMDVETSPYKLFNHIPEMHNQIWRGKNLGTSYTNDQKSAIQSGTFDNIWVGDYWIIGGNTYRVMHVNYPFSAAENDDSGLNTSPNIVVQADDNLKTDKFFDTTSEMSSTGILGAYGMNAGLTSVRSTVQSSFGVGNIVPKPYVVMSGEGTTGTQTASWSSYSVVHPSLGMILGFAHPHERGVASPQTQLAAWRLAPNKLVKFNQHFWLQTAAKPGAGSFPLRFKSSGATSDYATPSVTAGYRPIFVLG